MIFRRRFVQSPWAQITLPLHAPHHRRQFLFSHNIHHLPCKKKTIFLNPPHSSCPPPSRSIHPPLLPRRFFTIPTLFYPPLIFTGLLLALWGYKCVMLVLFQNRIIYMPSMPPFSRSERIADYAAACRPVVWREERITCARDGTRLAVAVGEIGAGKMEDGDGEERERKRVVIIYFQGNGSSLPPRLPSLSSILKLLHQPCPSPSPIYTILALSYRGYWTSTGRPSEPGLILDAEAMLAHAARAYPPSRDTRFVLWGQSLGASVALTAAAAAAASSTYTPVHGLILETPFLSIRAMLWELYPQPWLPYRYLAPFLHNHWDAPAALQRLASSLSSPPNPTSSPSPTPPPPTTPPKNPNLKLKILILQAARDELVPPHHAIHLERACLDLGFSSPSSPSSPSASSPASKGEVHRVEVGGALHTDVMSKAGGKAAVTRFLTQI